MNYKKLTIIMLLATAAIGWGGSLMGPEIGGGLIGPNGADAISRAIAAKSNVRIVYPGDAANLQTIVDAWESDASATKKKTILFTAGTYTLSGTLTLDTNYLCLAGESGLWSDVVITRATGGATVTQTADIIEMMGITIHNAGSSNGDFGLYLNCAESVTNTSIYRNCYFYTAAEDGSNNGCYAASDFAGTWYNCKGGSYAFIVAKDKDWIATMYDCIAGKGGFFGDQDNDNSGTGVASGSCYRCVAGDESFGGCGGFGMAISGYLEDCIAGDRSYALGKNFSGTAVRCIGGYDCFGGSPPDTYRGTFSGLAIDCKVKGGASFGLRDGSSVYSGRTIGCTFTEYNTLFDGTISAFPTIIDNSASATVTFDVADPNADLTFTAKQPGSRFNDVSIEFEYNASPSIARTNTNTFLIYCNCIPSGISAIGQATACNSNGYLSGIATCTYDGTGLGKLTGITALGALSLSGGIDPPSWDNDFSGITYNSAGDINIMPFYNGLNITNSGASGATTKTLPEAYPGLKFKFLVAEAQELRIDVQNADAITYSGGTMADGEYIYADAFGESLTLECLVRNEWVATDEVGTWVEETP